MANPFNYPGNYTSVLDFVQYIDSLIIVGDQPMLGVIMVTIIGFVALFSTMKHGMARALGYASLLALISSILLRLLGLVSDWFIFLCGVLFIMALIGLKAGKDEKVGV